MSTHVRKNCRNFVRLRLHEITELYKGVHCVDLSESFQMHIFLQKHLLPPVCLPGEASVEKFSYVIFA